MLKNKIIIVKGISITTFKSEGEDFISLTDIARNKNSEEPKDVVKNWMRSRTTIEFLGIWEQLNNPQFKGVEFDSFMFAAGILNMDLFGKTARQWREENRDAEGNIRDQAEIEQLVVLSNMESINAVMIHQGLEQSERLLQLNRIAITQMKSLVDNKSIKRLNRDSLE